MITNMKKTTGYLSVIIFALGLAACGSGGGTGGSYKKMKDGAEYKIISDGKGDVAKYGEVMKFRMSRMYKDSVLGGEAGPKPPQYQPIDTAELPKEFYEIFKTVRKGDSIIIRILTDSAFKNSIGMMPKEFKKGEYLLTTIKVLGIVAKDKAQADFEQEIKTFREQDSIRAIGQKVRDDEAIQAYLAKNNIKAEKTEEGTYYEVQQTGSGEPAKEGQSISVKYTGTLLDGTVFDSNVDSSFNHTEPYTFTIGRGGSIKGFDDGLRHFNKGAKGRIFIPSVLGYGSQGQGKLKPNSNLIFQVEVLDIKDEAPAPTMPARPQVSPVRPGQKPK